MCKGLLRQAALLAETAKVTGEAVSDVHGSERAAMSSIDLQTMRDIRLDCLPHFEPMLCHWTSTEDIMRRTSLLHSSERLLRKTAVAGVTIYLMTNAAMAGSISDYLDSKGGCQSSSGPMMFFSSAATQRGVPYFGKAAEDWTDEDVAEWGSLYASCLQRWPAEVIGVMRAGQPIAPPPGAIDRKVAEATQRLRSFFIDPARAAQRQRQAAQEARSRLAKAAEQRQRDEMLRESEQRAAQMKLQQDREIEREKTRRDVLIAQAEQDRQAADRAKKQAAEEAPLIAAAEQDAAKARAARTQAETSLDAVRKRIGDFQQARASEDAASAAAASKQADLQRVEAERKQDEALDDTCAVSADQFAKVGLGMTLRQVRQTFGCKGSMTDTSQLSAIGTMTTYIWRGQRGGYATTIFNDNSLVSKSQTSLKR